MINADLIEEITQLSQRIRTIESQLAVKQQLIDAQDKLIQAYQDVIKIHEQRIDNLLS